MQRTFITSSAAKPKNRNKLFKLKSQRQSKPLLAHRRRFKLLNHVANIATWMKSRLIIFPMHAMTSTKPLRALTLSPMFSRKKQSVGNFCVLVYVFQIITQTKDCNPVHYVVVSLQTGVKWRGNGVGTQLRTNLIGMCVFWFCAFPHFFFSTTSLPTKYT